MFTTHIPVYQRPDSMHPPSVDIDKLTPVPCQEWHTTTMSGRSSLDSIDFRHRLLRLNLVALILPPHMASTKPIGNESAQ